MKTTKLLLSGLLAASCMAFTPAMGQAVGSLDNFDTVNDTGETAEGFEIDIEDISPADLTREFPSNFAGMEYVQRFGVPTVTAYDNTPSGGHKGVKVTWAATWDATNNKWVAKWGSYVSAYAPAAGDGVVYVPRPAATQGDSCWLLGQGKGYATSGCDHFGISFAYGVTPGLIKYHWLVPDPANPGTLIQHPWTGMGPVPPTPVQVVVPPAVPGGAPVIQAVVHAVEAPEVPEVEPQWSDAVWVKTYTSVAPKAADLDALQANLVPRRPVKGTPVKITWNLLQRAPVGQPVEPAEKEQADNDAVPAGKVALVKRYEYYHYTGVSDPETHEAICAPERPQDNGPCTSGPRIYTYVDPVSGASRKVNEKGKFYGAHMEAFNLPAVP